MLQFDVVGDFVLFSDTLKIVQNFGLRWEVFGPVFVLRREIGGSFIFKVGVRQLKAIGCGTYLDSIQMRNCKNDWQYRKHNLKEKAIQFCCQDAKGSFELR